ncbi:MAG: hypothetical protein ACP5RI_03695 [Candidatus Micrarchaeia archaeon]
MKRKVLKSNRKIGKVYRKRQKLLKLKRINRKVYKESKISKIRAKAKLQQLKVN